MSTFSETGSFRITSGAIQATVPANDILVLLSLSSFEVPKSEIFTRSSCVISMLERWDYIINNLSSSIKETVSTPAVLLSLTWGTWGLCGWFCGGEDSSCLQRCPWPSPWAGMAWSSSLLSAPRTAVPGRSTPWWYNNKEPGYRYLWQSKERLCLNLQCLPLQM